MAGFQKINADGPVTPELFNRLQDDIIAALAGLSPPVPFESVNVVKDYTATGYEGVIHVDAARGPVRITLPKPSSLLPPLSVKQVNQAGAFGTVTIAASAGAKKIAGASSFVLDDSGTGSATFTSDGQQHWPSTGAGGNPPVSPPASQIQYVGKAPIYVTGNVIGITLPELVPATRRVDTTAPLVGGGPLSSDLVLGVQGAIVSGDPSTTAAQNLGALTPGVLQISVAGSIATVSTFGATANRIPFGSGSNNWLTDNANFQYVGNAIVLAERDSVQDSIKLTRSGNQQITKGSGSLGIGTSTADTVNLYTSGATRLHVDGSGNITLDALATAGFVKTNGSGLLSIDTTSYLSQAYTIIQSAGTPQTQRSTLNFDATMGVFDTSSPARTNVGVNVPAATDILISAGAATQIAGDSTLTYDTTNHLLSTGATSINGASLFTNTALVVGKTTNSDRDRVQFNVGGGTLGATGAGDNTFVDIIPGGTAVRTGVSGGIYATARIRGLAYTAQSGTPAIAEVASLYIDNSPTVSGVTVSAAANYALHVAAGVTGLDGNVLLTGVKNGGGAGNQPLYIDSNGFVRTYLSGGSVLGVVNAEQPYYISLTASTLVGVGNQWLETSQNAVSSTAVEYPHAMVPNYVHLKVKIINNPITSGTMTVGISKNGSSIGTLTLSSGSSGVVETATIAVSSPALTDTFGMYVSGSGTSTTGALAMTATLIVSPFSQF